MKEELQSKALEIMGSIQAGVGQAADFAKEQLPDIAQSYIAYGRAWTTTGVVLSVILLVITWVITARCYKEAYDEGFVLFLGGVVTVGLAVVGCAFGTQALLVWFAPKVWLIKELAGMFK